MTDLTYLRDVANEKRRRFPLYDVSPKASALFRKWLQDYQAASTLQEVFDEWGGIGYRIEKHLRLRARLEGKHMVAEFDGARPPWAESRKPPYLFNDEFLYLVCSFITTPGCERLRLCPECAECYIAIRPKQKCCGSQCSRRAASRRTVANTYAAKRQKRIEACRAAYAQYRKLINPSEPVAEYVRREANRHLHSTNKFGGEKHQTNFITHNAKAIGIPKGAL